MGSDNVVTFEAMVDGYTDAVTRFEAAAKAGHPTKTYNAVFEALNWAVALDDRIGKHWMPDGQPLGFKWRLRAGFDADLMGGLRFARNSVHHQWSDALRLDASGVNLPTTHPVVIHEWRWRSAGELPKSEKPQRVEDEVIYRERMDGQPVSVSLDILNGAFYTLGLLLEPHNTRRRREPLKLGEGGQPQ